MAGFWEWMLESSLLVLIILGIRKMFMGRIRYAGIYALWIVVLLRFMIPVNFISTPFSVGTIILENFPANEYDTLFNTDSGQPKADTRDNSTVASPKTSAGQEQAIKVSIGQQGANQSDKSSQSGAAVHWQQLCLRGCLTVSALLMLWFVLSNASLMRRLKRNRIFYGRKETVKIYAAIGIKNPCLYGFFRPVIYLPQNLIASDSEARVSDEEIEQMITHEYVHYLHRDHIWAMLRMLLVSVYWFDPFMWLAVSCSKKDAELFCDETVIRILGEDNRFDYGKMLVRLAGEANWGEFRYPIMLMSRKGKEMEKRIRAISERKCYSRWLVFPLVVIVIVAMGITCSAGIGPSAKSSKVKTENVGKKSVVSGSSLALNSVGEGEVSKAMKTESSDFGQEMSKEKSNNASADASTLKKVFQEYIKIFTEAVNTGNTAQLSQVLDVNSDIYAQQCNLVKNYYKRGIKEEVKMCTISNVKEITSLQFELESNEKIKVSYTDSEAKLIKQKYCYTCEYRNKKWVITKMEEIH